MNRQDMDTSISAALSTGELQDQPGESGAIVRAHSSAGYSSGPGGSPQNGADRIGSETLSPPSGGGGPLADESDDASAAGAAEPIGRQSPAVSAPLQGAPMLQLAENVPPDAGLLLPGRSASLGVSSAPAEHRSSPRAPSMPALSPRVTSASSRAASQPSKAASSASPPPAAPSERSQGAGEDGAARPPLEQSGVKRAASVHAGAAALPLAGAPPQPGVRRPQSAGTAARGGAPLGAALPWALWGVAGNAAGARDAPGQAAPPASSVPQHGSGDAEVGAEAQKEAQKDGAGASAGASTWAEEEAQAEAREDAPEDGMGAVDAEGKEGDVSGEALAPTTGPGHLPDGAGAPGREGGVDAGAAIGGETLSEFQASPLLSEFQGDSDIRRKCSGSTFQPRPADGAGASAQGAGAVPAQIGMEEAAAEEGTVGGDAETAALERRGAGEALDPDGTAGEAGGGGSSEEEEEEEKGALGAADAARVWNSASPAHPLL
jgi:hypothetical protein